MRVARFLNWGARSMIRFYVVLRSGVWFSYLGNDGALFVSYCYSVSYGCKLLTVF